jgi:glucosamine 6-phosphate synthetase-like amidotransferase/phosphosugar isomerase protein
VIGYGDGEMFLGSDALALAPLTRRITYLEEGDWAVVTSRAVTIFDAANREVVRPVREAAASGERLAFGIAVPGCDPFVAPLLYAIPISSWPTTSPCSKGPMSTSRATSPRV